MKSLISTVIALLTATLLLSACTTPRPHDLNNACAMFEQYPSWYWDAKAAQEKWGVTIGTQLAFMYQESHFNPEIRPPRTYLLGFIPWFRPTTAFGYTQSLDMTWRRYQKATGNYAANRDDFADATDFIGWYAQMTVRRLKINRLNAQQLYLAYHEGVGGFERKTYESKPWLITISHRVQQRADRYSRQLRGCAGRLSAKPWWHF